MGLNARARIGLGIAGTIGAVICALGAIFYVIFPDIVAGKVKENLKLQNGSQTYQSWESAPIPIYMQMYMYNVTNVHDFMNATLKSKPILQQLGPYTFREYREKVNISFNDDYTVSYKQLKFFHFVPELSEGSLDDEVTTLNLPLVSLAVKSRGKLDVFQQLGLNNFIRIYNSTLFITKTVGELLFDGYKDELMIYLAKRRGEEILPNGTFGFFYGKNGTDDGVYTVHTGVDEQSKFLNIAAWEGNTTVDYWNSSSCNMINGTDGSMFKSQLKKEDTIYLFSTDLCRSLYMKYEYDTLVHSIKTYRFAPPFELLAAPDITPENKCYCPSDKTCMLSGALNIGACRKGAPVILTPPHFYQSDPTYLEAVEGLSPSKEEHSTVLDIEPTTGAVLRAARRLQINVELRAEIHITQLRKIPLEKNKSLIFPILWLNESAELTPERAEAFKEKVIKPQKIGEAVSFAMICIGAFIILVVLGLVCFLLKRQVSNMKVNRKVADQQMSLPHMKYEEANKPFLQTKST